jgi:hypothetical protein
MRNEPKKGNTQLDWQWLGWKRDYKQNLFSNKQEWLSWRSDWSKVCGSALGLQALHGMSLSEGMRL